MKTNILLTCSTPGNVENVDTIQPYVDSLSTELPRAQYQIRNSRDKKNVHYILLSSHLRTADQGAQA